MIAIVDYDTGNLRSVCNALSRIGAEYCVTDNHEIIKNADKVLLPGVGEASSAMQKLSERGLCDVIKGLKQPVLGICIGLQLMCKSSEEGDATCLGIFDTVVRRFEAAGSDSFVYQYAAGVGCDHHFHLKCAHCGNLLHMECDKLNEVRRHILDDHGFLIGGNSIIYGVCADCRKGEDA